MFTNDELEALQQIVSRGMLTLNGEQARLVVRLLDKIEQLLKEQAAEGAPETVEG